MIQIRRSLLGTLVIIVLSACGPSREQPKPKAKPSEIPKLESAIALTLVPLSDGGVYAVDEVDGAVWYVSNGNAVQISALKGDFVNQIVPALEGGAYLHVTTQDQNGALWYLRGETATKVREGAIVAQSKDKPRSTEHWLWAMWQSERLRRQRTEHEDRG